MKTDSIQIKLFKKCLSKTQMHKLTLELLVLFDTEEWMLLQYL